MAGPGNLYVFLHGYSVVEETKSKWLQVVLPDIPGHVQTAGSWLAESHIAKGSQLRLTGVQSGSASFRGAPNTVVLKGCYLTGRAQAATLRLPPPREVIQLLIASRDPASPHVNLPVLERLDHLGPPWMAVPTQSLLIYDYNDSSQVALENHYWEPYSVNGAISLHIFSDSEHPEGDFHEQQTEYVAGQVIGNYPGLNFPKPRPVPPTWNAPGLPFVAPGEFTADRERVFTAAAGQFAFAQEEMEELEPRSVRLRRLGRIKQQGRPLGNVWHDADPLDGPVPDCVNFALES